MIFNYRPGFVSLELLQNICKGRRIPKMSWQYFNKHKPKYPQNKKRVTPKNSVVKNIELGQKTSVVSSYTTLLYTYLMQIKTR